MSLEDLVVGARLLRDLPGFFGRPLTAAAAQAIITRRLERREADLLWIARQLIYRYLDSPYRGLLAIAGCEYGDLERLVGAEGVDGALEALLQRGVYLSVEEFKGRRPAVRGSATVAIEPRRLRNPRSAYHVPSQTGGTRGDSTALLIDLAFLRDRAANSCAALEAQTGRNWVKGVWQVPGGAIVATLRSSAFGEPTAGWFTLVSSVESGVDPRYRWAEVVLEWGARLGGVRLPRPQHVPIDDPLPIASWMAEVLRSGRTPHLRTFVSPAVRLCQAADMAGLDLAGAQMTLIGEPITAARLAAVRQSGLEAVPTYGSAESGECAYGCLAPEAADECHVYQDLVALIQAGAPAAPPGLPVDALFVTSLRPTTPVVLLNVSMGDQARVNRRRCGCPLEGVGWTTHLHTIRSFEKLTAGGMTLLDVDVIQILEEVLPARFGGGPTSYQLVEELDDDGRVRLRLLVDPALGPLDVELVASTFLKAIGAGSGAAQVMSQVWRDARFVRVERQPPLTGANGKIHHLFREHRTAISQASSSDH